MPRQTEAPDTATERDGWLVFHLLLGAAIGVLWAAIQFAPASWLCQPLQDFSGGHILLADCTGTVWQGSAILVLSGGAASHDRSRLPGRVHWRVALHRNAIELALQADCCTAQTQLLRLAPAGGGWQVHWRAAESRWPLALLQGLGAPWNSLQLRGDLLLSSRGIHLLATPAGLSLSGSLAAQANHISTLLSGAVPLGSYQLHLTGGEVPSVALQTLDGDLHLSGQGSWSRAQLHMTIQAGNPGQTRPELESMLGFLGVREGVLQLGSPI